jgi:RNA-directed DNA polymerase
LGISTRAVIARHSLLVCSLSPGDRVTSGRGDDPVSELLSTSSRSYEWVLEADVEACFDSIDHAALMCRVRHRGRDRRVIALVKAFLKAGVLTEDGTERDSVTGTPQGGILSPMLANIALSVLDDHFDEAWRAMGNSHGRERRRRSGQATYRLVRYADDFVVVVAGARAHAEALQQEVAAVLRPMGLRLSAEKTRISHIDEGFDFLGFRIRREQKRGGGKRYVYTYPSRAALQAVRAKVRALSRQGTNFPLAGRDCGLVGQHDRGAHRAANSVPSGRNQHPSAPARAGSRGFGYPLPAWAIPVVPIWL